MNTIKQIKFIILAMIGLLTFNSCVQDDDFAIPPVVCNDTWTANMTIAELMTMAENSDEILSFDTDQIVEGYVVSSDSTGNFFKTVSLQDSPSNPTRALQVEMDRTNLFNNFPLGSKVKVNLNGLNVAFDRGALKIGETYEDANGNIRVGRMAENKIDSHVVKSCDDIQEIQPVVYGSIDEAIDAVGSEGRINTLVTIQKVQFAQTGVTYADAVNQVTVNLNLEGATEATNSERVVLRNSGFADFAGETVPEGSGSITAVLSAYDANNNGSISPSEYQLFIRDTNDVKFNNPRYEAGDVPGPGPIGGSDNTLFSCLNEGFSEFNLNNDQFPSYINDAAWGSFYWQVRSFDGNNYIQMSAHNSPDDLNVAYFVVPVDFDAADSFSFKTKDGYHNGNVLSVFYSTDYVWGQSVETATLNDITSNFTISSGNTNGYGVNFVPSGSYDLSSLHGGGVIIFKYEGNPSVTTTMQIEDIQIVDNENPDCGGNPDPEPGEEPELGDGFLFPGADFENWDTFLAGINSFGLKPYATQSPGNGVSGAALSINTPSNEANDYVFTTLAHSELPSTYSTVKFRVKGTSAKSISLNLYKTDGDYYRFNLGDVSSDKTLVAEPSNQYTGVIDTAGEWVEITLDLSGITDLNTNGDITQGFFALKIGHSSAYDLLLDNFIIE